MKSLLISHMESPILFLLTGGTIDSYYDGMRDTVTPHKKSILPKYIKNLKLHDATEFVQICMKDSREITEEDREQILENIEQSDSTQIIITHGTYTMPVTARYLKKNLQRSDQTIVLTGAMIPHEILNSDAAFNLGYAVAEVKRLSPGIYVCMNGRIFTAEEAAKDISQGRFVSIFTNS